ncbi:hypothetical protein ACVXG7_00990 [Enterobacter hormaechei]
MLSALLVNAVGVVGFIGLFAPLLAKILGARLLLALMLAPLIGALILAFRSAHSLAGARLDGSFRGLGDGP